MSEYEIPEEKRAALELWVDNILTLEGIRHLEVVKMLGNRKSSKINGSEIDADELQILGTTEAVLDRVVDSIQGHGGRMSLRLRFEGYDKPGGPSDMTKSFQMRRVKVPSTKSQGGAAATEQLASSLATAFDAQASRVESRDARVTDMMANFMLRNDEHSERRLSEHSTFQQEIMRLQSELARRDMQLILQEQNSGIPPEVWVELLKGALPVAAELVGAVSSAVGKWGSSFAPALAAGATAPATAPIQSMKETT